MEFNNLKKTTKTNKGGYTHEVLFIDRNWLDTIGQPVNDGTPGSRVTITTAHTLKTATDLGLPNGTTVGWNKAFVTEDTAKLMVNANENRDASGGSVDIELFIPGDEPEAEEFVMTASTKDVIVLLRDPNDKTNPKYFVQIGDETSSVQFKGSFDSATGPDGAKGFKVKGIGSILNKFYYRPAALPTLFEPA